MGLVMRPSPRLRTLGGLALGGRGKPAPIDAHHQPPLSAAPESNGGVVRLAPIGEERPASPSSPRAADLRQNIPRSRFGLTPKLPVTSQPVRSDMLPVQMRRPEKGNISRILRTVQEQHDSSASRAASSLDDHHKAVVRADSCRGADGKDPQSIGALGRREAHQHPTSALRRSPRTPRTPRTNVIPEDPDVEHLLQEQAALLGNKKSRPRQILEDMYRQEDRQRQVWWEALTEVHSMDVQESSQRMRMADQQAREELADCRRIHKAFNHQNDFDKQYSCYSRAARAGRSSGLGDSLVWRGK